MLRVFPSRRQWRRWTLPSRLSFIGALFSLLAVVASLVSLIMQPRPSQEIGERIAQLDEIQVALTTLERFVASQRDALDALSTEKSMLEEEKERLQKALEIDREELDALLGYQATQNRRRAWLEIVVSFFVGVLSSSVVTLLGSAVQSRRNAGSFVAEPQPRDDVT